MAKKSKKEMLDEMQKEHYQHDLTEKDSWNDIAEEYEDFKARIDEDEGEDILFPNGRDYEAEDEDGPV